MQVIINLNSVIFLSRVYKARCKAVTNDLQEVLLLSLWDYCHGSKWYSVNYTDFPGSRILGVPASPISREYLGIELGNFTVRYKSSLGGKSHVASYSLIDPF